MMEIPTDIKSIQPDNISADEMVEVEYIEVAEEDLATFDTTTAPNYFGTSEEADTCDFLCSEPKDVVSSDEPEEASDNQVPSKSKGFSRRKRFKTESDKLEYNRQKASSQRVRRQNLVEGLANLRAVIGIGTSEREFKTCRKLLNHVSHIIPLAEKQIECQKYRISYLENENSALEEKIRDLELEKASALNSANNTHEQEERPNAPSHLQSS